MATDYEDDLLAGDDQFQARIDDLVSSALKDQAREKRFLMEMVSAAKAALTKAEHELTSLRQFVEHRDESVVDLLEARLSGMGTERSIEDLAAKMNMMLERPPVDEMVVTITDRIGELAGQLGEIQSGLRPLDPWPAAMEIQRMIAERVEARLEPLADALADARRETLEVIRAAADEVTERLSHRMNAAEEALAGDVDVMQEAVVQRLDSGIERSSSLVVDKLDEAMGHFDSRIDRSSSLVVDKLDEAVGHFDSGLENGVSGVTQKLDKAVGQFESGIERSSSLVVDKLDEVATHFDSGLESGVSGVTEKLHDLSGRVEGGFSHNLSALTEELSETRQALQSEFTEMYQSGNAKMFDRMSQVDEELVRIAGAIAEIPSAVEAGLKELQTFTAEREQDLREAIHAFGRTIADGEQQRSEVLGEQIGRISSTIDSYRPVVSRAIHDAMTPFAEEVRALGERLRQTNRRITESNSRMEAMHESLIAYLSQRDQHLETVREKSVVEMLEQLEETLNAKERAKLAGAMKLSRQRRKDRRDAERYRRMMAESKPVTPAERELILEEMTQARLVSESAVKETPPSPAPPPAAAQAAKPPKTRALNPPASPRVKTKPAVAASGPGKAPSKRKTAAPKAQRKRAV